MVEGLRLVVVTIITKDSQAATCGHITASTSFQAIPSQGELGLPPIEKWEEAVATEIASMGKVPNTLIRLIHRLASAPDDDTRRGCVSGVMLKGPPGTGKTTLVEIGE